MRDLRSTKFYAIFLVSVVLVGIFSISPAISSLTNDVIIRSTGQILTIANSSFYWYTDFSQDVLEPRGGGYYGYIVTTWPFSNNIGFDEADYTAAIINDPTATGGKSLYFTRPDGRIGHCTVTGNLRDIGYVDKLYMDVRMKLPSDFSLDPYPNNWWTQPIVMIGEGYGSYWYLLSVNYKRDNSGYYLDALSFWNNPAGGNVVDWGQKYYIELPLNQWFHIKTYTIKHLTQGIVKVWLNDQLIIDVSNKKTSNDWWYSFTRFGGIYGPISSGNEFWIDTIYVSDVAPSF